MSNSLQSAYILHVRNYRESSGLIDFLTREHGRITLLARGYRKSGKSAKLFLQPFRELSVGWRGRGELKTLAESEDLGLVAQLHGNALASGLYINELMCRVLQPLDPHPELYDLYEAVLTMLASSTNIEITLRIYERDLLEAVGYGLQLTSCSEGDPVEADAQYCYVPETGPVKTMRSSRQGVMVHGESLLALASGDLQNPRSLKECKMLMRHVLFKVVGGKPFKARELFNVY